MKDSEIERILHEHSKITVVGLSDKPDRPSYGVTQYMITQGYEIYGVRPAGPDSILNRPCFKTLAASPQPLEIVDVFRSPEHIPALVDELIPLKPRVIWLQLGITHKAAEAKARAAGIAVVSDRCILVEHRRLIGAKR